MVARRPRLDATRAREIAGQDAADKIAASREISDRIKSRDDAARAGEERIQTLLMELPNLPDEPHVWALASYMMIDYEGQRAVLAWLYDVTKLHQATLAAEAASQAKLETAATTVATADKTAPAKGEPKKIDVGTVAALGVAVGAIGTAVASVVTGVLGLAPMAVLPERQRRGIGSRLARRGLDLARDAGFGAVVVLGHPAYYPRFGFVSAATRGLSCEYSVPDDVFMVAELIPGALAGRTGVVKYHPEFARL